MFQNAFQSGVAVEVISVADKHPQWSISKAKWKHFDKSVKGYAIALDTHSAVLAFPKSERQSLGLVQPFLVLQGSFHVTLGFSVEVCVVDTNNVKRRLLFTTSAKELTRAPTYARVPLTQLLRGGWVNLSLDLVSFVRTCFPASTFRSIHSITIHSYVKLRRVFTMRRPLHDSTENRPVLERPEALPKSFEFPVGVAYTNQVVTADAVSKETADRKASRSQDAARVSGLSPAHRTSVKFTKPLHNHRKTVTLKQSRPAVARSLNAPKKLQFARPSVALHESVIVDTSPSAKQRETVRDCFTNLRATPSPTHSIMEEIEVSPSALEEHDYYQLQREITSSPPPTFYSAAFQEALQARPYTPPLTGLKSADGEVIEEEVEVVFDSVLKCYLDPSTGQYYQLNA